MTGRPPFNPSPEQRRMVETLAGFGIPQLKICYVVGIDQKTLLKHFPLEIEAGAARVEAALAGNMFRLASQGRISVTGPGNPAVAFRANEFLLQTRFGWTRYAPPPAPSEKERELGKKEQRLEDAGHPPDEWADILQ